MKKKIILVLLILIVTHTCVYGYSDDVLYFKNGNVIRGEIIEIVPNDFLRIRIFDGSILQFRIDEIEKMVKEEPEIYVPENVEIIEEPGQKYKGFVGPSLGLYFPIGKYVNEEGMSIPPSFKFNFVNMSYMIEKNIGIAASFWTSKSTSNSNNYDDYSKTGVFVGPTLIVPTKGNFSLDIRAMYGYTTYKNKDDYDWGLSIGGVLRFNVSEDFVGLLLAEYFTSSTNVMSIDRINAVAFGVGIGYLLR